MKTKGSIASKKLALVTEKSSLKTEETAESNLYLLTPIEIAKLLKFSTKKVYRLISNCEIPFKKIGGQYRFVKIDIERWLKGEFGE
ncbi:MAG: helix-turn-helix domain-containing protein [Bdellovibrionota bacterium]